MSKPRSAFSQYCVYLVVRAVVALIQALPFAWCDAIANGLAWLLYKVDRRHRDVARDNLRHAFGEGLSGPRLEWTIKQVYRHFARMLLEILHAPRRLRTHNWRRHIELVGGRQIVDCLLSDRPLLIVTGHFGNWEIAGYALGLLGFRTYAIARTLDNPYVDKFLRQFRENTGQRLLAKKGDFDQMQEILEAGGVIATLADQDAGQRGLYIDFFGRPASTHKAIALMALEYQVPLVIVTVPNQGRPLDYSIRLQELIRPEDYASRPNAVKTLTERFTKALERGIRQAPEQYFWLHRRWKHQPAAKRRAAG
jgi:Kdo2-lipid IVA lauroyltransferase/acyltransferase